MAVGIASHPAPPLCRPGLASAEAEPAPLTSSLREKRQGRVKAQGM